MPPDPPARRHQQQRQQQHSCSSSSTAAAAAAAHIRSSVCTLHWLPSPPMYVRCTLPHARRLLAPADPLFHSPLLSLGSPLQDCVCSRCFRLFPHCRRTPVLLRCRAGGRRARAGAQHRAGMDGAGGAGCILWVCTAAGCSSNESKGARTGRGGGSEGEQGTRRVQRRGKRQSKQASSGVVKWAREGGARQGGEGSGQQSGRQWRKSERRGAPSRAPRCPYLAAPPPFSLPCCSPSTPCFSCTPQAGCVRAGGPHRRCNPWPRRRWARQRTTAAGRLDAGPLPHRTK